jgi:hypothetical protein
MTSFVHRSRGLGPARPGSARRANDQAPGLCLQLNLFGQLGLFQQRPWDTNPPGIADTHNTGLRRHVTTL